MMLHLVVATLVALVAKKPLKWLLQLYLYLRRSVLGILAWKVFWSLLMAQSAGYYNLRQALAEPGCPVCRILTQAADSFVDSLLYELVNDVEMRRELRRLLGVCREHARLLIRPGASLGVSIISKDLLDHLLQLTTAGKFEAASSFSFLKLRAKATATAQVVATLEPQSACPICVYVDKTEAHYLADLLTYLPGPDGLATLFPTSDGLCLPHFRLALAQVSQAATFALLVEVQATIWQRLSGELAEFIRKNDHRFAREEIGSEGDAWRRAVEALSGPLPAKSK
jgi:hypothetical protein